jgi:hypothetical protein
MPAPLIMAVDAATQTGICSGRPGDVPRFETVNFGDSGDNHLEVGARALRWIAHRLTDERPDQLWIEEPLSFEGSSGKTTRASLVRLNGLYMLFGAAARLKGVPVHDVLITSARKGFLGHGRLKRDIAKRRTRAMCRLLGWSPANDDEADAGALWWFACLANDKRATPPISKMMFRQAVEIIPPRYPMRAA